MTPEQETILFNTLGDIKGSQGRIEQQIADHLDEDRATHARHDAALAANVVKTNQNATGLARLRGIGAGIGGVFTLIIAFLGLDTLGGG